MPAAASASAAARACTPPVTTTASTTATSTKVTAPTASPPTAASANIRSTTSTRWLRFPTRCRTRRRRWWSPPAPRCTCSPSSAGWSRAKAWWSPAPARSTPPATRSPARARRQRRACCPPARGDGGRYRGDRAQQHLRRRSARRRQECDPSRRSFHEPEALRRHRDPRPPLPAPRPADRDPLRQGPRRGRDQGGGEGARRIGRAQGGGGIVFQLRGRYRSLACARAISPPRCKNPGASAVLLDVTKAAGTERRNAVDFRPDLAAIRAMSAVLPGALPLAVNGVRVAASIRPRKFVIEGGDDTAVAMPRTAFQIVYPDCSVMIDSGLDKATHDSFSPDKPEPYFAEQLARLQRALASARLLVLTHHHADHVAGVLCAPNFSELAGKTNITLGVAEFMINTPP